MLNNEEHILQIIMGAYDTVYSVRDELMDQDLLQLRTIKIWRGLIPLEKNFDSDDQTKVQTKLTTTGSDYGEVNVGAGESLPCCA